MPSSHLPVFLQVANHHRLGSLDVLLLLVLMRRAAATGDSVDALVPFPNDAMRRLIATYAAARLAARRLERERLVQRVEMRRRLHYRLSLELVPLAENWSWERHGLALSDALIVALSVHVHRGRDVVVLLHLLDARVAGTSLGVVTVQSLAGRLQMPRRSVYRAVARIEATGAIRRVRGGWDLAAFLDAASATSSGPAVTLEDARS